MPSSTSSTSTFPPTTVTRYQPPVLDQSEPGFGCATCLDNTPSESVGWVIAAAASRVVTNALSPAFLAISASIFVTKLVFKLVDRYHSDTFVNITKEVCKLNRNYPKLQLIGFIFTTAISFLSRATGFACGLVVGAFASVILSVDNYRLIREANREALRKQQAIT